MDDFVEELIDQLGSSYDLVVAAAKRARQLRDGARPLVDIDSKNPLTIALQEIAEGSIILKPLEETEEEEAEDRPYLNQSGDIEQIMKQDEEDRNILCISLRQCGDYPSCPQITTITTRFWALSRELPIPK